MFVRAGLAAALAPMMAAVELATLAVLVERHEPLAETAADPARQEVGTPGPASDPTTMRGGEGLRCDDRLVVAGEPLPVHLHLAEIDARAEDGEHRGVVDAGVVGDDALTGALGPQREDAADDRRHVVGDQLAVDEVVAGLGPIDPLALAHGLLHAHAHVLRQLLAVELREGTEDVVEHPARCRREVNLLGKRVQRDVGLAETVGQHDEIAQIPRQAVEAPGEHVGDVSLVDHVQQLL
jgi:hypothetical protein